MGRSFVHGVGVGVGAVAAAVSVTATAWWLAGLVYPAVLFDARRSAADTAQDVYDLAAARRSRAPRWPRRWSA